MATNARMPPPPPATNGVVNAPSLAAASGNRKKQKRRAKQAAKVAALAPGTAPATHPDDVDYDEDPLGYGEDDYDYSDGEPEQYHDQYIPPHNGTNGHHVLPPAMNRRKKQKKRGSSAQHHGAYSPDMLSPIPHHPPPPQAGALRAMQHRGGHAYGNIWNTSTVQERQNIKNFWLSLSEDERKSLLKIEKDAVLRKMKQQQKHSCSCTVCGRKRTAIEEELEVLYEGYYEELEQYAHHDPPSLPSIEGLVPNPLQQRRPPAQLPAPPPPQPQHRTSNVREHLDEEEYSDDEEYSDSEEEYSDEEPEPMPRGGGVGVPDFFNFGQNLTVKGILTPWLEKLSLGLKGKADNLLTVADDLLKNDGRKFIEMMEQLAERRMARENEAEYAAANPSHPGAYPPSNPAYNHEDPLAAGEEYDDEEGSYDSQEEYDDDLEEEDEMVSGEASCACVACIANRSQGGLTEEQRMQEGRRMFQIFAARMFEQRVLNAYREKVAAERQQQLMDELENEKMQAAQQEEKKQRDAQKKRDRKKQQQQAKAEEKAKRDAEKAEEEARLKAAEDAKQEEQRRKREEQRKKKDEEKRKLDEERTKKEAEKARRQQEELARREDSERKARELKTAEKAKKDEARKREREEREAREKEASEARVKEDAEKRDRESKSQAEKEVKARERRAQQVASQSQQLQQPPPQITKRPSQAGLVAKPGALSKQLPSGLSSPHPAIVTPALPKTATTGLPRQRQPSKQGSTASSPKQTASQVSSIPSKSSSPGSSIVAQHPHQPIGPPKQIMQKPGNIPPHHQLHSQQQQQMQPPPGMPHPQHHHHQQQQQNPGSFGGGMSPMPFQNNFQPHHGGPMMHQRGPMPMYHNQHPGPPPTMGLQNRMPYAQGMNNGMQQGPPAAGMLLQQQHPGRGMGFPFDGPAGAPPGFQPQHSFHQTTTQAPPPAPGMEMPRNSMPAHSRHPSKTENDRFDPAPVTRPAPIQRPSSVKPPNHQSSSNTTNSNNDIDDLSKHLGSSALLADDDGPLPLGGQDESRRHSGIPRNHNGPSFAPFGTSAPGFGSNWNMPFGGQLSQQNWGGAGIPTPGLSGWGGPSTTTSTTTNPAFAPTPGPGFASLNTQLHAPGGPAAGTNRPLTIRLAVCQACKQLSSSTNPSNSSNSDGFHAVDVLLRQIGTNRPRLDAAPTLREIEEICETEGDALNGGGELDVRYPAGGGVGGGFSVKWSPPGAGTPDHQTRNAGLGEIGSPLPTRAGPTRFGAPGMGRTVTGGFGVLGSLG